MLIYSRRSSCEPSGRRQCGRIHRQKSGAVTKWPLKDLRANYAMALNEKDHRLFNITRKIPMMVVLDTQSGKEVAHV